MLGELAGLDKRRPMTTSVAEFVADIPADMACGSAIWTQHGYVGGRDPVDDLERALERKGCETPADLDHRDRRRRAAQRRGAADVARRRRCARAGACTGGCASWYRDPRVTVAFQYTFREDDLFPTGLVTTDLSGDFPALGEWTAWGGRRPAPTDPPPANACS